MDTVPEKHPEERFQIVHKAVRFAEQCTDGYKHFGPRLAGCARCVIIADSDGKVEIDEETIISILRDYDITDRYITVEKASLQERLMP